jgi:hypothetical protein
MAKGSEDRREAHTIVKRYAGSRGTVRWSYSFRDDTGLHVYVIPLRKRVMYHVLNGEEVGSYKTAPRMGGQTGEFKLRVKGDFSGSGKQNRAGQIAFANVRDAVRFVTDHPDLAFADDADKLGHIVHFYFTQAGQIGNLGMSYDTHIGARFDKEGKPL